MDKSKNKASTLTKVTRPQANSPVLRPRLFERLEDLRNFSMIWIAGPPGSGKTTLASSYLSERGLSNLLTPEYLPGLTTFTRRYAETIGDRIKPPAVIVLDNYEQAR